MQYMNTEKNSRGIKYLISLPLTRTVPDWAEVAEAEKFTSSRYAKYRRLAAE